MRENMTPKAKEFQSLNATVAIVAGAWVPSHAAPKDVKKIRYRFEDGKIRTLSIEDVAALNKSGFTPRWISG